MNSLKALNNAKSAWVGEGEFNTFKLIKDSCRFIKIFNIKLLLSYLCLFFGIMSFSLIDLYINLDFWNILENILTTLLFIIFYSYILQLLITIITTNNKPIFKVATYNFIIKLQALTINSIIFIIIISLASILVLPGIYLLLTLILYIPDLLISNQTRLINLKRIHQSSKPYLSNIIKLFIIPIACSFISYTVIFDISSYPVIYKIATLIINTSLVFLFMIMHLNLYLETQNNDK